MTHQADFEFRDETEIWNAGYADARAHIAQTALLFAPLINHTAMIAAAAERKIFSDQLLWQNYVDGWLCGFHDAENEDRLYRREKTKP